MEICFVVYGLRIWEHRVVCSTLCSWLCWLSCKTDLRFLDIDPKTHQGLARTVSIKRGLCQDLNIV